MRLVLTILFFTSLTACTRSDSTRSGANYGLAERPSLSGLTFPADNATYTGFKLTQAFSNLTFSEPVLLTQPRDNSDLLFVVEKTGKIWVFENEETPTQSIFLDISTGAGEVEDFTTEVEQGLLGLAFDSNYATNRYFYVFYSTYDPGSSTRKSIVARYQRLEGANEADTTPANIRIVLEIEQDPSSPNHRGGMLAFGPNDGYLYISTGDGKAGGDPDNNAQNCQLLLGKILRIDPNGGNPYAIPADNPFVGGGSCGRLGAPHREEIWAYGVRHPWRFSFDQTTGDLWLGDVGQDAREEIDIVTKGANLGWRIYEGNRVFMVLDPIPTQPHVVPIFEYRHKGTDLVLGSSVTGGYVYRGAQMPQLLGNYIFGDFVTGGIFALDTSGTPAASLLGNIPGVASFGEDRDGEIYAVSYTSGQIFKIEADDSAPDEQVFPELLSQTGLFTDLESLTWNPGLIPYDVNTPLWSDGATKRRWIGVPDGSQITFAQSGAFTFPEGTVLVKHFEIETVNGVKRLETRVLINETSGWAGYTYRWNNIINSDAQTDAALLSASATETLPMPEGETQTWYFPSRQECLRCHSSPSGLGHDRILGVRAKQLNREFDYPDSIADNQLRSWNHIELFDSDIGDHAQYGALAGDARSYLDANCSFCHQPGGGAPNDIDFRYETPTEEMKLIDVFPTNNDLGIPDARRVKPGDPATSVLWERMRRTDQYRMPPLSSLSTDSDALLTIEEWIRNLAQ